MILVSLWFAVGCHPEEPLEWDSLKARIREEFPQVNQITVTELARLLTQNESAPILLDARSVDEFEVSHLRNAKLASTVDAAKRELKSQPLDALVIVYCSVGYRSTALADKLRQEGYSQVYNLEGSIFQWANEGRPVFRRGVQVDEVHPYDAYWGQLLNKDLWQR